MSGIYRMQSQAEEGRAEAHLLADLMSGGDRDPKGHTAFQSAQKIHLLKAATHLQRIRSVSLTAQHECGHICTHC